MIYEINHKTTYEYSAPVAQSQHVLHLSPRAVAEQTTRRHSLVVEPAPAVRSETTDAYGNTMIILDVEVPHETLVLHALSTIERRLPPPIHVEATLAWDRLDEVIGAASDLEIVLYRCASRLTVPSSEILDYAKPSFTPGRPVLEAAMDLTMRIHRDFLFDPTATDISTPVDDVFRQRRGVCQDFAHLALTCLRALRVPARYVSGYILTHPPPGQPKLRGTDASHAWVSVWCPEAGWRDFDPTNGLSVADEHIVIAYGRDYNDVSPISGVLLGGGEHSVAVSVDVAPV